ncbi:hypothetical protein B0H14DRAFT_2771694 [Mycena olivaceomarginata]|nr:hypothetical protein B0H14DRAFT_2771694 [Mycena olivaceomarginata]
MVDDQDLSPSGLFSNAQNFVISGGAFNVTNITQGAPATSSDFPKIPLGEIDLQREICLDTGRVVRNPVRRIYSARVRGCQSNMTVAIYQGVNAEGKWRDDISRYTAARHPNVIQLFATATSSGLHAGIFHDELIPYLHLLTNMPHSPLWKVYFWGFVENEFCDAVYYICSHNMVNLVGYILWIRPSSGRLCVDLTAESDCGPPVLLNLLHGDMGRQPLLQPAEDSKIIASMTLTRYHHICWIHLARTCILPITTPIGPEMINCRFSRPESGISTRITFDYEFPTFECSWYFRSQTAVATEQGWTRIDSAAIGNRNVLRLIISLDNSRLCEAWLAQANHIFKHRGITSDYENYVLVTDIEYQLSVVGQKDAVPPGYLFLCPLPELQSGRCTWLEIPDCIAYWSTDPLGAKRLSAGEAEVLGFPSIRTEVEITGQSWCGSVYQGLRYFHHGKGFDPDSQNIARYLQLPLFRVSEALKPSSAYVEETNICGEKEAISRNDQSVSDYLVAQTSVSDNPEIAPHHNWDVVMVTHFMLILTFGTIWLYGYIQLGS